MIDSCELVALLPPSTMLRALLVALSLSCCNAWVVGGAPSALVTRAAQPLPAAYAAPAARSADALMMGKPKKDVLELEGVVLEALPSATFRVQLDDTEQVHRTALVARTGVAEASLVRVPR